MQTFFEKLLTGLLDALPHILWALVAFFVGLAIANWLSRFVLRALKRSKVDPTVHTFLAACVKIFVLIIAILTAASLLGIPTASIITLIGGAAVGIGLALKDNLSNFASGMILLFTRPFKVGDYIETDEGGGTVERIDMMFTVLVTPDNKNIMLPNSLIVGGKVTNFSACQTRRISIPVTIPYSADLAKVRQTLAHYVENEPRVLKDPPPCIGPDSFTDRGVQISVMAWVERSAYWDVFYDLHETIQAALDSIGVPIAVSTVQIADSRTRTDDDTQLP